MPATLTKGEQETLERLLNKANAANVHAPAMRVGEPYVALVNLSVPRRNPLPLRDGETPQNDLVLAGDTVYLTDEEAARFNRHDPIRDGRRIEVVRKVGTFDPELPQRVHPSLMTGPINRPQQVQGGEGPRPDPPGSSHIVVENPVIPESTVVTAGSENAGDAIDTVPQPGMQAAYAGADMDIVNAAKAAMGQKG